jgi:hypothetical protein
LIFPSCFGWVPVYQILLVGSKHVHRTLGLVQ